MGPGLITQHNQAKLLPSFMLGYIRHHLSSQFTTSLPPPPLTFIGPLQEQHAPATTRSHKSDQRSVMPAGNSHRDATREKELLKAATQDLKKPHDREIAAIEPAAIGNAEDGTREYLAIYQDPSRGAAPSHGIDTAGDCSSDNARVGDVDYFSLLGHKRGSPPRGTLMDSRNADFGIDLAFMEKRDALLTELSAWPEISGSSAVDTQRMALRLWREQQNQNSLALETTAPGAPRGARGVSDAPHHPNYHRQIPSTPKPRVSNIVRSTLRDCKCKRCGASMFQIHLS
jgi:hypothetical protein